MGCRRGYWGLSPSGNCCTLREMIIENLLLERQQVAAYTTLMRELGERDPTTRRLLVEILADTERHASE
jgi:bacterioferritin